MILSKFSQCFRIGMTGIILGMTFAACTDDHFIVQDGSGDADGNATQTLWELICANPELSNFKLLAEKTPVFKDEKHPIDGYTFKDVLNGKVVLTVFAPDNNALTDADVQTYEALLQKSPYDVFLRLVGNHIARNRYVATGTNPQDTPERIVMLNNKKAKFDRVTKAIKDVTLATPNISATNGVLHIVNQQVPFAYNIYEYIRANSQYQHLINWLNQHDTLYFDADRSAIAGTNPETGEPVYVDSVYTRYNSLYYTFRYEPRSVEWSMPHKGFGRCNLELEDSIWAMIVPTDVAWDKAVQEMSNYYTYADEYFDKSKEDALKKDNKTAKNNMILVVKDTLKEAAMSMDLVAPLVFNVRQQKNKPEGMAFWTLDAFISNNINKLFNTRADTFTVDEKATQDVKSLLFDGQAPIQLSNGVIYPVNNWNLAKTYGAKDVIVKAERFSIFQDVRYNLTDIERKSDEYEYMSDYENNSFNSGLNPLAPIYGNISKNSFMTFLTDTDLPKVTFKLTDSEEDRQIFSGLEYEIGIVMVPDFYRNNNENDPANDSTFVFKKNKMNMSITYLSDSKKETSTKASDNKFEYSGEKVDTIWTNDKGVPFTFTFPYSYRNLSKSYPTITISSQSIKTKDEEAGYQKTFSIDRIILRPKTTTSTE